mmetsp:Transcript_24723/g.38227  ORF Transcript_24723/g.38227 Transcript_24723/m.38227 type:complete len:1602 (-) Transcript_24723:180-4985(-)
MAEPAYTTSAVSITLESPEGPCSGGLFSLHKNKNKNNNNINATSCNVYQHKERSASSSTTAETTTTVQFRLSGLDPDQIYTVTIEAGPRYAATIAKDAQSRSSPRGVDAYDFAESDVQPPSPPRPGTVSFIPNAVLGCFSPCASTFKNRFQEMAASTSSADLHFLKQQQQPQKSNVVGIFEIEPSTFNVRRVSAGFGNDDSSFKSRATVGVTRKRVDRPYPTKNIKPGMLMRDFQMERDDAYTGDHCRQDIAMNRDASAEDITSLIIKNGSRLIRRVSDSESTHQIVKKGSRLIHHVSHVVNGTRDSAAQVAMELTAGKQQIRQQHCIVSLDHAVPVSIPVAVEASPNDFCNVIQDLDNNDQDDLCSSMTRNSKDDSVRSTASNDSVDALKVKKIRNNAKRRDFCERCNVKTHKRKGKAIFRKYVPLNIDGYVDNGQCLHCLSTRDEAVMDLCGSRTRSATVDVCVENFKSIASDDFSSKQPLPSRKRFATDDGIVALSARVEAQEYYPTTPSKSIDRDESSVDESWGACVSDRSRRPRNDKQSSTTRRVRPLKKIRRFVRKVLTSNADHHSGTSDLITNLPRPEELLRPFSPVSQHVDIDDGFSPSMDMDVKGGNWKIEKVSLGELLVSSREPENRALDQTVKVIADRVKNGWVMEKLKACSRGNRPGDGNDNDDFSVNETARVIFVGGKGSGRSSLVHSLKHDSFYVSEGKHENTCPGIQIHEWEQRKGGNQIKLRLWDFSGVDKMKPMTQEMFFSNRSIYVLVWDMGISIDPPLDSEDSHQLAIVDEALMRDIDERVIQYLDSISKRAPGAMVVPVLTFQDCLGDHELDRRVALFKERIMKYLDTTSADDVSSPVFAFGENYGEILTVSNSSQFGVHAVRQAIVDLAMGSPGSHHVGRFIPQTWVNTKNAVESLRKKEKICSVKELKQAMGGIVTAEDAYGALRFLNDIGEISYFGEEHKYSASDDEIIFLRPAWLLDTVKSIVRSDLRERVKELNDENEKIDDIFSADCSTNMPVITLKHARMLTSHLSSRDSSSELLSVIERLLVEYNIMHSVSSPSKMGVGAEGASAETGFCNDDGTPAFFFLPGLLQPEKPVGFTYKCKESWKKTICNSWLFRNGVSSAIMQDIILAVLRELYVATRSNDLWRICAVNKTGKLRVRQILGWSDAFSLWIDYEDANGATNKIEISVRLVDRDSAHCLSSDVMTPGMKKLIVSGKGHVSESDGTIIWKGGYELVTSVVREVVSRLDDVKEEIVCPICLANNPVHEAKSWDARQLLQASYTGSCITCEEAHRVDTRLITGKIATDSGKDCLEISDFDVSLPVTSLYESVVLVALWDGEKIFQAGSGFIVNGKKGIIVSAAHTVMNLVDEAHFGDKYYGKKFKYPKILIGVLREKQNDSDMQKTFEAVYRYSASIVAENVSHVDACVLRIVSKFDDDLAGDAEFLNDQTETALLPSKVKKEGLKGLQITERCEIEEHVRIIGYRQEERIGVKLRERFNRSIDFSKGYVREIWRNPSPRVDNRNRCEIRKEILASCLSIGGYSGGPMVNQKGEVIGIVRAGDRVGRQCYVVPVSEFKDLVQQAEKCVQGQRRRRPRNVY